VYWCGLQVHFQVTTARADQLLSEIEALPSEDPGQTAKLEQLTEQLNQANANLLENSMLGRTGRVIEPIFAPLGWDWKIGVGVLASFPAREVIIATLGTIYSLGGDVDEEDEGLRGVLKTARWPDGRPVFTVASGLSIMVFFALCCAMCVDADGDSPRDEQLAAGRCFALST
jgi:ferrous iron transport protein B